MLSFCIIVPVMVNVFFLLSNTYEKMNGIWYCEEHNMKISIHKNVSVEEIEIDYLDDLQRINTSETTTIRTINDVTGLKCQLGDFTVFFDGENFLHFLAYFSEEKSYLFERV